MTTEPKPREPFKSCTTDFEAIRKRRDELIPPPANLAKEPLTPVSGSVIYDCGDCG